MSENKHTPGPWQFEDCDPNEEFEVFVPAKPCGRYVVASICYGYDEPFESQQHANARLIAAAPELLAALDRIESEASVEEVDPDDCRETIKQIARAAIDKALGR